MAIENIEHTRRFVRIGFHTPVTFQVRGEAGSASTLCDNLSESGLRMVSQRYIAPRTPVMLEFTVARRSVRPVGKVAWISPVRHSDRNHIGIEFIELGHEERDHLKRLISTAVETFRSARKIKGEMSYGS